MDGIKTGDVLSLDQALEFALRLSLKGKGHVEPNPCVGCVVLNDEFQVQGFGYHTKYGEAHAEVEAFQKINQEGLTAVVTLEPCSHHGKTPPCAELLKSKKIKKLIYIDKDPHKKICGKGLQILQEAGIEIQQADSKYSLMNRKINRRFFHFHEKNETFFHAKWAQTLDGKMAIDGESKWITGEQARNHNQFLRAQNSAVLIGKYTLFTDNPSLNIRLKGFEKKNKVILLDPQLESVPGLHKQKIASVHHPEDIIIIHSKDLTETNYPYSFLQVSLSSTHFDLNEIKQKLASVFSIQSVLVEGGPYTLNSGLKQKAFDFASVFIAPKILGNNGDSYSDALQLSHLDKSYKLKNTRTKHLGPDVLIEGEFSYS